MEFNMSRFFALIRRDWMLHRKLFFTGLVGLFIFVFLVSRFIQFYLLPGLSTEESGSANDFTGEEFSILMISFVGILFIIGGLLTSSNLGDFRTRARRIDYITLPASILEKVMSKWLYTLPLFVVILISMYLFFYQLFITLNRDFLTPDMLERGYTISMIGLKFLQVYFVFHGIAFFFSFYFDRFVAIKGGLVSLVIFLILSLILNLTVDFEMGDSLDVTIFYMLVFIQEHTYILMAITPILWVATYFVFKRKSA